MNSTHPDTDLSAHRELINTLLSAMARQNATDLDALIAPPGSDLARALAALYGSGAMAALRDVLAAAVGELEELKLKARSGAALAGIVRKRLALSQKAPGRQPALRERRLDPALLGRLRQKHLMEGLHALIAGDFDALDPAIGDASCEMRPFFLLDLRQRALRALEVMGIRLPTAQRLMAAYRARHAADPDETAIRTAADLAADPEEAEDMALWRQIADALTMPGDPVDARLFLSLCRGYTLATSLQEDDFLLPVSSRVRRKHPLSVDPWGLEALGRMTVALMAWAAADVVRRRPAPALEAAAVMLAKPRAFKDMEGARLPLLPIYEAMRVILTYECLAGRPLILSLIRLGRRWSGTEHRFELIGASPMLLVPDADGRYGTPGDLTPFMRQPGYVYRCFSVIDLDAPGAGLLDPALAMADVKRRLAAGDVVTHLLAYAAAHPPFADGAEVSEAAMGSLHPNAQRHAATELRMPLSLFAANADPLAEIAALRAHAAARGAVDARYSVRLGRDAVRRLDVSLDFAPIHIHAGTMVGEIARLSRLSSALAGVTVGERYNLKAKRSEDRIIQRAAAPEEADVMRLVRRA
jgi:hypothetical protein